MMLKRRTNIVLFAPLSAPSAGLLGTEQPVPIDRQWPIEEIQVTLLVTVNAQLTMSTATTNAIVDNIQGLLKSAVLTATDGSEPRTVVKASGAGLLEYASQVGLNIPRSTLAAILLSQAATVAASLKFRITYRIPLVNPMVGEPLRTRMLFPAHKLPQDPILTLAFANLADFTSAGTLTGLICEVRLIRRLMPDAVDQQILATGGYIPMDLIETPFPVSQSSAGENNFDVPLGGQYMGLLLRSYLGGSTITRDVLDETNTLGSETKWQLKSGNVVHEEFRFRNIQDFNDLTRVANLDTQSVAPNFAGAIAANTRYQPASSIYLDFLSDGLESADELGSLLDCNIPSNSGLKMQLNGRLAASGTYAHTLYMIGHRMFGDISKYQAIKY